MARKTFEQGEATILLPDLWGPEDLASPNSDDQDTADFAGNLPDYVFHLSVQFKYPVTVFVYPLAGLRETYSIMRSIE